MKKNKIMGLITVTALSLGTLSTFTNQKVDAASTYKIQLTHNAAIYNSKGKRSSRIILKKGKILSAYNIKKISGKKYYHLTRGRYIKQVNAQKYTVKKSTALFTVNVPDEVKAFTAPNGNETDILVAGNHNVYEQKADAKGTMWYRIGKNQWITSSATDKSRSNSNSDNTSSSVDTDLHSANNNTPVAPTTKPVESSSKPSTPVSTTINRQVIEETTQAFVQIVNKWRAEQGLSPVTINTKLYDHATQRAETNAKSWDTYQHSDHHAGAVYNENMTLIKYGTPMEMAQEAFNQFVYNDAAANYGHREALRDNNMKRLCVGLASTTNNGYYKNGVAFVEVQTAY